MNNSAKIIEQRFFMVGNSAFLLILLESGDKWIDAGGTFYEVKDNGFAERITDPSRSDLRMAALEINRVYPSKK